MIKSEGEPKIDFAYLDALISMACVATDFIVVFELVDEILTLPVLLNLPLFFLGKRPACTI